MLIPFSKVLLLSLIYGYIFQIHVIQALHLNIVTILALT